ncbi:MAG TPA: hypothetical protein VEO93_04025 [Gemmatimonadales bacterium]|nr:hypothetical protein [Gemmatimonadales bacterium]
MPRPFIVCLLMAVTVAGCERRHEAESRAMAVRVLQGVLVFPGSQVVNVASGADAAEVELSSPASLAAVALWYHQVLRLNGWELRSDAKLPDGGVTIYAEQGRRPLWITLHPTVGARGTTYNLIGAQVVGDTVK